MEPFINVLIRTSHRPGLFKRAIDSVQNQTFRNFKIIVGADGTQALAYAEQERKPNVEIHSVGLLTDRKDHFWNLHCNYLMRCVREGWFFFLDDDDFLYRFDSLSNIAKHLTDPDEAVICQYLRNGIAKPVQRLLDERRIELGRIGAPSLFLHSKHKLIAEWDGHRAGDFRWIRDVTQRVPAVKFVPVVVVETGNNGLHGQ